MTAAPFFGRRPEGLRDVHEGTSGLWAGALLLAIVGIVSAVFPKWITGTILGGAVSAVRAEPIEVSLHLWHGWTLALFASMAALFAGVALFRWRDVVRENWARLPGAFTPTGWYHGALNLLTTVGHYQTLLLQNGLLRYYMIFTITVTTALVGGTLLFRHGDWPATSWTDFRVHEAGLALLTVVAAISAVQARSRFAAVAALGAVGYSVALIFAMFGALDLALTQFLIETLTVILLVLVLYNVPAGRKVRRRVRWRDLVVCASAGVVMTALVLATGEPSANQPISGYFLERSIPDGHGRNVVNVILVDFRAIDTLGEIAVLGIAAVGVFALLRLRPRGEVRP